MSFLLPKLQHNLSEQTRVFYLTCIPAELYSQAGSCAVVWTRCSPSMGGNSASHKCWSSWAVRSQLAKERWL